MIQKYPFNSNLHKKKIFKLKENKSEIIFKNPQRKEIEEVIVDGWVIVTWIRCDYMLIEDSWSEHFIELKGSNIPHAIKQLVATFKKLSVCYKTHPKKSYISSTKCPLASTEIQNEKIKFQNHYKSKLIVKNSPLYVSI